MALRFCDWGVIFVEKNKYISYNVFWIVVFERRYVMNKRKLDSLLWENIPIDNFIICGHSDIEQENLDDVFWDDVDELYVTRDDNYNISISCVRYLNQYKEKKQRPIVAKRELIPGETIPEGSLKIKIFDDYTVTFAPMYCNGYESKLDKTNYKLSCYRVEGKSSKIPSVIKEWILNGSQSGLYFCGNSKFEYKVEGSISGIYGDLEFPIKEELEEQEYNGRFIHFKYKDTAFDIHFVGNKYGPSWSTNLSISYFEEYGRIPSIEERKQIREYLSFFIGKRLIYIGETSFDENGNQIGFIMEYPRTRGFDIKKECMSVAKAPIRNDVSALQNYFDTVQKYIEPFSELYEKLDFDSFFLAYWYAQEVVQPMNLPIFSAALENLKRKWYEEVELNPETVLMDKKDFSKRIKPIKELVETQFAGTEYVERMKRTVEGMNRMSVSEQLTHFFEGIDMVIGRKEKKVLQARNFSAHGSFGGNNINYEEQFITSQVYECMLVRVILKLLKYEGKYIDYGTIGYPEKNINCPSGSEYSENP